MTGMTGMIGTCGVWDIADSWTGSVMTSLVG
jgi:hypothetical protein